jgi:hypothetical protein
MKTYFSSVRLALASLAVLFACVSCTKKNEIDLDEAGAACDDGQACEGSCVEGICRAYCAANYTCAEEASCVTVEGKAVCLPKDARTYQPYAPFDLLTNCKDPAGCEVPLDALTFQGKFERCAQWNFTQEDFLNNSFDFAAACPEVSAEDYFYVKGRTAFKVRNGECDGEQVIGSAGDNTLVKACSEDYVGQVEINRLVRVGSDTYLWTEGPRPHTGPGADDWKQPWYFGLWKLTQDKLDASLPSCEAASSECSLPTFSRVGGPASQFAGMWVECAGQNPEKCEEDWAGPALNEYRTVYYIRPDGFGEVMLKAGDAYNPKPATCTAAFRVTANERVLILGHHDFPIGYLTSLTPAWLPKPISSPSGEFIALGSMSAGDTNIYRMYKKVHLPSGFVDPCDSARPSFKF